MIKPANPPDEDARLAELRSCNILDTLAEKEYDDLTRLAARICGTPTALISLVDRDRQWFKSRVGLDATETPRDWAFCAHAIHDQEPLIVPDALEDERFRDNPLVTAAPNIRFYAGTPLRTGAGHALGTLCVIDYERRQFTAGQKEDLEILGRQVTALLDLRRKTRRLAELNEEKNLLLGAAAHDLRNPLGVIQGFSEFLLEEAEELTGPHRIFLERIHSNSRYILRLVDDTLDLAAVEAGTVNLRREACDLARLTEQCLELSRVQAERKNISIESRIEPDLPQISIDSVKIEQVIQNLIGNAIKYTDEGGRVDVLLEQDASQAVLRVRDTGRGISQEDLKSIFRPFFRAQEQGTAGERSTGLGLAIAERIIGRHGGKLDVISEPGRGSEFVMRLPYANP
ncbi:MAG: GAF domain-containing sensor histidine kinase [Spirochaetales bacterium]|nr:GAF domain-containing sensor histidine kinase [Leptospiraceae bacterium]MCP5482647.1 GAF domain-containing sensor histidine kinase [Spirochaetales bacterium]MCP5485029.1 GAF domain-containing sensor histidine kinase [Spirochaetales bacterium]